MNQEQFHQKIKESNGNKQELEAFINTHILTGVPVIFTPEIYYTLRQKISDNFNIQPSNIYVVGSAKLGFSTHKMSVFRENPTSTEKASDIDVGIIDSTLFNEYMKKIGEIQYQLRENRSIFTEEQLKKYHKFLEYTAIGWIFPIHLPPSYRDEFFDFFENLGKLDEFKKFDKINGGIYKDMYSLIRYQRSGLEQYHKTFFTI